MGNPPIVDPEDTPHAFAAAWNRRDADGIAELFDPQAEFVNVVGLWWHDREAIRRAHAYGLERIFPASRLRVGLVRSRRIADGVAIVTARMHLTGQSAVSGAREPRDRVTIFTFVLARPGRGSAWRCVAAHNTDVVPGAETNVLGLDGRLIGATYRGKG